MTPPRNWEDVKAGADKKRRARGLPVRSEDERRTARKRMLDQARAWQLAEIRRA